MKNNTLRSYENSINNKEGSPYLLLIKQEARKKVKGLFSWDLQENDRNGELEMRGRRGYLQLLFWKSLARECKGKKREKKKFFLSWA